MYCLYSLFSTITLHAFSIANIAACGDLDVIRDCLVFLEEPFFVFHSTTVCSRLQSLVRMAFLVASRL